MDEMAICLFALLECSEAIRECEHTHRQATGFMSTDVLAAHLDVLETEALLTDCTGWVACMASERLFRSELTTA